jgi:uncharacterized membrane protein YhiD involved in acid resistance
MEGELGVIFGRMLLAVVAGGLIGLERSFHGRAAGSSPRGSMLTL